MFLVAMPFVTSSVLVRTSNGYSILEMHCLYLLDCCFILELHGQILGMAALQRATREQRLGDGRDRNGLKWSVGAREPQSNLPQRSGVMFAIVSGLLGCKQKAVMLILRPFPTCKPCPAVDQWMSFATSWHKGEYK